MSKYNFGKRLKRMLNKECAVTTLEAKIGRRSAKCYEEMSKLKTVLVEQAAELDELRENVEDLRLKKEELERVVKEGEEWVRATKAKNKELEKECEDEEKRNIVERQAALMKMQLLRQMTESTQTHFNVKALPHKFQGVKLIEKENTSEWKPFRIDVKAWIKFIEEQVQEMKQNEAPMEEDSDLTIVL